MEERAVGGKEKKYVLYTVVNDDKARAGLGVWMVRILLGSLLLVALAVVPYVSLRLAQVNDRTLVVFQPVPIHNHSRNHHHGGISRRLGTQLPQGLESSSLVRANYTTDLPNTKKNMNASLVTLHESAVTLSLLEDTNNVTHGLKNQTIEADEIAGTDEISTNVTSPPVSVETKSEESKRILEKSEQVNETRTSFSSNQTANVRNFSKENASEFTTTALPGRESNNSTQPELVITETKESKLLHILKSTTAAPVSIKITTTLEPTTEKNSTKAGITHKLAYVATSSSGNHVGGICVWKTNKNVTKWSYFYDNIPIEFQSHKDSTDHEMRAIIAAVRLWADQWHDYHVALRSQHSAVEQTSQHPAKLQLLEELNKSSEEHFTYELEWKQRKDDSLMGIAYCLARLHKDFDYWFNKFQQHVDQLLGEQDWPKVKEKNRVPVPQILFVTKQNPETEPKIGDFNSINLY